MNNNHNQILNLGIATEITLGGGGYHNEGTRPKPSYSYIQIAVLGSAQEMTRGGGKYGVEHGSGGHRPRV